MAVERFCPPDRQQARMESGSSGTRIGLVIGALLVGLASACAARNVKTVPRGTSCPEGYRWAYDDQVKERSVCVRADSSGATARDR